jgi:hypothetical protein
MKENERRLLEIVKMMPFDALIKLIKQYIFEYEAKPSPDSKEKLRAILAISTLALVTEKESMKDVEDEYESIQMAMALLSKK